MYKRFLFVVVSFVFLLLTACGGKTAAPVVRAQPNAEGGISTFQVEMRSTYKSDNGLVAESPKMTTSYLFREGSMAMRLDMSGMMFPDSQARVLAYDSANGGSSRLFLADGLKPDLSVSSEDFNGFSEATGGMMDMMFGLSDKPFMKLSADAFVEHLRVAAFDVTEQTEKRVVATRNMDTVFGQQTMTLYFDTEVGAITEVDNTIVTPELTQITESIIKYTQVEGIENSVIPYEIIAESTIDLTEELEPMELPVSDVVIELEEGQEIPTEAPEGTELVEESISPIGQGTVGVDTMTIEQTIRYDDIKVNEVPEEYITLGDEQ